MASRALATAFVNIVPGTKELDTYLKRDLPNDADAAGKPAGDRLGGSMGQSFGSKFKGVLGPIIATAAAAFGAVAFGKYLKEGVDAATQLQGSIAEVVTLTGNTGDAAIKDFGKFKKAVKGVSGEFGIAQDVLTKGLYGAISAGVPKDNAMKFLQVASKASIAGVTDVSTAVDGISTVINGFGLKTEDAQSVADSLFTAVKGGKTTFEQLSASIFQIAPSAAAAGVSMEETNAAVATLTAAGVPTSVATTQIRAALVGLQKPSAAMTGVFNKLGYESAQAAIKEEGLQFALDAVNDAAGGSNGKLQTLLGSTEAVGAVNVLAGTGAEKFTAELAAQEKAAGSTQAAFETVDATRSAERNKVAFQNLSLAIGDALLPIAVALTDFLQNTFVPFMEETLVPVFENISTYVTETLVPGFTALSDWFKDNKDVIAVFAGVLGGLLIVMNLATIATTAMSVATKLYAIAQGILNTILALNPITLIIIAVAALAAGIYYLITRTTVFQDAWETMTAFVSKAWEGFKDLFGIVIGAISDFFTGLVGSIKESWETMTEKLGQVWEGFTGFLSDVWENFKTGFDNIVNGFKTIFETVFNGIGDFFKGIVNGYISMFENFINFVINGVNGLIRALNKIQLNIPSTPFSDGFTIGVNLPTLSNLNIPRLAEGGYVDKPTTAIIGDAGPEVVTPLKDFERMMGLDGSAKTLNYYAAPNESIDSERDLFTAMRRSKVVAGW
jgi:TP901 family phage tail tape measure protein